MTLVLYYGVEIIPVDEFKDFLINLKTYCNKDTRENIFNMLMYDHCLSKNNFNGYYFDDII